MQQKRKKGVDSALKELAKGLIRFKPNNFTFNMWGGRWIPAFKQAKISRDRPVGESWEFSGHKIRPSQVIWAGGRAMSLIDVVARVPDLVLGKAVVSKIGRKIPFLLKFIDAQDNLSIQVHPGDSYAKAHEEECGKSESWLILQAGDGSEEGFVYLGFRPGGSAPPSLQQSFWEAVEKTNGLGPSESHDTQERASGLILPFINKIKVKPGDVFDLPAGVIHAIGKGVQLFEIQQTSDTTYRVWDWNRLDPEEKKKGISRSRPLHVEQAKNVIDFTPRDPSHFRLVPTPLEAAGVDDVTVERLIENRKVHFEVSRIRFQSRGGSIPYHTQKKFSVLTVTAGVVNFQFGVMSPTETTEGEILRQGETVLVPAALRNFNLKAASNTAEVLRSTVPL